jgi:hypothetical protein
MHRGVGVTRTAVPNSAGAVRGQVTFFSYKNYTHAVCKDMMSGIPANFKATK